MRRDDVAVARSGSGVREIDRRTIAKGVAWTVPVVIVATAAPAAAASQPQAPSVSFAQKSGTLNPAAGSVTFSITVTSSGAGQIRFTLLDNAPASGLSFVQPIGAGSNSFTFTVTPSSAATVKTVTLTYTVDNGATYQTVDVQVISPTTFDPAASGATRSGQTVTFTLAFKGDAASVIKVRSVVPDAGSLTGVYPTAGEKLGADLVVTFTMTRNQTGAKPTKANVALSIDGGPDATYPITVP